MQCVTYLGDFCCWLGPRHVTGSDDTRRGPTGLPNDRRVSAKREFNLIAVRKFGLTRTFEFDASQISENVIHVCVVGNAAGKALRDEPHANAPFIQAPEQERAAVHCVFKPFLRVTRDVKIQEDRDSLILLAREFTDL